MPRAAAVRLICERFVAKTVLKLRLRSRSLSSRSCQKPGLLPSLSRMPVTLYAVSEDGRLHGEMCGHAVREEYNTTRETFRWQQIVGLARVTASAGICNREDKLCFLAACYEEACQLLGLEA